MSRLTTSLRVMVVEDHADSARLMALILRRFGYEVDVHGNGPSALAAAVEFQPDVVLLDLGLPGMDGYQVAGELRALPQTQSATLIAISGYNRDEDRQRCLATGFDFHLGKPLDWKELRDLLKACESRCAV